MSSLCIQSDLVQCSYANLKTYLPQNMQMLLLCSAVQSRNTLPLKNPDIFNKSAEIRVNYVHFAVPNPTFQYPVSWVHACIFIMYGSSQYEGIYLSALARNTNASAICTLSARCVIVLNISLYLRLYVHPVKIIGTPN